MQQIEDSQQLGRLIHQARKRQGLTQEQLSAASGVGIRFIRELEGGKASCHLGKALTVLQMLGLSIAVISGNEQ